MRRNTKVTIPRLLERGYRGDDAFSISEAIHDELVEEPSLTRTGEERLSAIAELTARKLAQLIECLWEEGSISPTQLHSLIQGRVVGKKDF
jgi:hypothetical protein